MKALWIDATNGAAGDMLLAALLDAGADIAVVRQGLDRLPMEPATLGISEVRRHGLRAARVSVEAQVSPHSRNLADILGIISAAGLPDLVRRFAADVFGLLAQAEARVHSVSAAEVGFHEVGAIDSIVDIIGCGLALHALDLLPPGPNVVSPVAVGSGSVSTAHGRMPVPTPAVLQILTEAGAPLYAHPAGMELCTPTGAALLAVLASAWGPVPACTPLALGMGAGRADPAGHANVVRVLVAELTGPANWAVSEMCRIDATIDDLDPRLWPDVLDALHAAGAADAWCTPALMRKGRPGQVLSVLAAASLLDTMCQVVFSCTSTLGVRVSAVQRRSLRRDEVEVLVAGSRVSVKRGWLAERLVTVQPEYADVQAAARDHGRPVAEVLAEAQRVARGTANEPGADQERER